MAKSQGWICKMKVAPIKSERMDEANPDIMILIMCERHFKLTNGRHIHLRDQHKAFYKLLAYADSEIMIINICLKSLPVSSRHSQNCLIHGFLICLMKYVDIKTKDLGSLGLLCGLEL